MSTRKKYAIRIGLTGSKSRVSEKKEKKKRKIIKRTGNMGKSWEPPAGLSPNKAVFPRNGGRSTLRKTRRKGERSRRKRSKKMSKDDPYPTRGRSAGLRPGKENPKKAARKRKSRKEKRIYESSSSVVASARGAQVKLEKRKILETERKVQGKRETVGLQGGTNALVKERARVLSQIDRPNCCAWGKEQKRVKREKKEK